MSELIALKCNICKFVTTTKDSAQVSEWMAGWVTIGFTIRFRGKEAYKVDDKIRAKVRHKIAEGLGTKLHVCPGCVKDFEGENLSFTMIPERGGADVT